MVTTTPLQCPGRLLVSISPPRVIAASAAYRATKQNRVTISKSYICLACVNILANCSNKGQKCLFSKVFEPGRLVSIMYFHQNGLGVRYQVRFLKSCFFDVRVNVWKPFVIKWF